MFGLNIKILLLLKYIVYCLSSFYSFKILFSHPVFAWEAYEKGAEVHLQADPTKLEVLAREYKNKKEAFKTDVKGSILAKYGGEEHLEAPPKQLLLAQTVSLSLFVYCGFNGEHSKKGHLPILVFEIKCLDSCW